MKANKILAGFLLVFSLSFTILVGGTLPYFVFYVVVLGLSLPLIQIIFALKNIKGSIILPKGSLYNDDNIDINYRIDNSGFFSIPYLEIDNEISRKLTRKDSKKTIISLEKNHSYNKRESIYLNRRGYYKLVSIKVRVRDIFGIYSFKKTVSSPSSLLVYPRPIEINHFPIISSHISGEILVKDSASKDRSSINSFRDYVPGDSIKSIHWKLSGKLNRPIIKEYENSGDTNTLILLDNSKDNFSKDIDNRLEDKSVDIALSITDYCLNNAIPIVLKTQNPNSYIDLQGEDRGDLKSFLEVYAKLEANGPYSFKSFLDSQSEDLRKNTSIILISNKLNKEIAARILDIKMRAINIISIFVTDVEKEFRQIDLGLQTRLIQEAIPLYIIDYKSSIKEILEAHYE